MIGLGTAKPSSKFQLHTEVAEVNESALPAGSFCINLLNSVPEQNSKALLGPHMKMSLPSFSGLTEHNPNLLKYTCQMECRVRVLQPLQISKSSLTTNLRDERAAEDQSSNSAAQSMEETKENRTRLSLAVMLSKPILALEFNFLNMIVEDPLVISQ